MESKVEMAGGDTVVLVHKDSAAVTKILAMVVVLLSAVLIALLLHPATSVQEPAHFAELMQTLLQRVDFLERELQRQSAMATSCSDSANSRSKRSPADSLPLNRNFSNSGFAKFVGTLPPKNSDDGEAGNTTGYFIFNGRQVRQWKAESVDLLTFSQGCAGEIVVRLSGMYLISAHVTMESQRSMQVMSIDANELPLISHKREFFTGNFSGSRHQASLQLTTAAFLESGAKVTVKLMNNIKPLASVSTGATYTQIFFLRLF